MPVFHDACGLEFTATVPEAVEHWNDAVENVLAHARTLPGHLAALLEVDPDNAAGWCLKGFCAHLLARAELRPVLHDALARVRTSVAARGATRREVALLDALAMLAQGRAGDAAAGLEAHLRAAPDDSLAAKLAHSLRFMRGEAREMRASLRSVDAGLSAAHPHRGFIRGCLAFAFEETGDYARAEATGREALALAPRDAWGMHAVAHVFEMTGRPGAGIDWIEANLASAAHCNNFGGHVFWHLALFKLERGDHAGVLALYDGHIRADRTDDFRDIANGASLLARLALAGAAVGDRWEELADLAERRIGDGSLTFADLHYGLALAGAGRRGGVRALAAGLAAGPPGDQRAVAAAVGRPLLQALIARGEGRHREAATLLLPLQSKLAAIGGSHAQRDVFEQITLDSAVKGGLVTQARRLLVERLAARPGNRFATTRLAALPHAARLGAGHLREAAAAAIAD